MSDMQRIQGHPGTLLFRHAIATERVIARLAPLGRAARMLAFGCSWGAEIVPFAASLPDARILGVEFDDSARGHCAALFRHSPNVTIARSDWGLVAGEGPYDAILCNAVLCRYPDARDRDRLDNVFPYAAFLDVAQQLDAALKPGGLLMMYNANYALTETDLAYTPIPTPPTLNFTTFDNFVSCFAPDGRKRLHIDIQGPASFLDLADSEWEQPDAALQPLAEGLFVKAGGPAAGGEREGPTLARADLNGAVFVRLNDVHGRTAPHKPGYRRIPVEQSIRRVVGADGGAAYEIAFWWGDRLLAPPRHMRAT